MTPSKSVDQAPSPKIVDLACVTAVQSRCLKSRRGCVIFDSEEVVRSVGNNHPAVGMCDGTQACRSTCARTCLHAEESALLRLRDNARTLILSMLHVKIDASGKLVDSGPPSCVECSKLALAAGIQHFWLFHFDGWRCYGMDEFHDLTLRTLQLHPYTPVESAPG